MRNTLRVLLRCRLLVVVSLPVAFPAAGQGQRDAIRPVRAEWRSLLDDTLWQWEGWTGVPVGGSRPIGLGDPRRLFTVTRDKDRGWQLRVSGEVFGGLTTREAFGNYQMTPEVKWGTTTWPPRHNETEDLGDLHQLAGPRSVVRMLGAAWSPRGAVHVVNGTVVLAVDGARSSDGQPLRAGTLQLQSEGAEGMYRDVCIRAISAFPADIARLAGW
jgi:hypothetical protein